jgi:uncharacterized membrane protein YdbT with pleckstrin-like domain
VAFQEEELVARVRRSWAGLILPFTALFVAAALMSYISNRVVETWFTYLVFSVSGLLVLLWLIAIVRHLNFYVELTTARIIFRDGIFGQKTTETSLSEVVSVDLGKAKTMTIARRGAEPLIIANVPKVKALVTELRAMAKL